MTNAHVVANATYISVQRDGDSQPEPAYVKFVAHDSDLAILEVKNPDYFKSTTPLKLGSLPKLRSPVATIGFPTGGEQISITQGIVSRVGYRRYVHHGDANHILVQVDSAINAGNSGGPVIQGRFVVGVAFQSFTSAENTGYIIPTPVIRRFLADVEDGDYDGHPIDGLVTSQWTTMNPSTAAFHGLKPEDGGVKVVHVAPWSSLHGALKPRDIILEIQGLAVGVDGKVLFEDERVDFRTIYDLRLVGDNIKFKIAREGVMKSLNVQIKQSPKHHLAGNVYSKYPKYFVFGGLVFTTLSRSYLRSWGNRWYKRAPLLLRYLDFSAPFEPDAADLEDIIVLAARLPHQVNAYATENMHEVITHVDGVPIKSMAQLAKQLETSTNEFAVIEFWKGDDPLIISRRDAIKFNQEINATYAVTPDRWLSGPEVDGAISMEAVH